MIHLKTATILLHFAAIFEDSARLNYIQYSLVTLSDQDEPPPPNPNTAQYVKTLFNKHSDNLHMLDL